MTIFVSYGGGRIFHSNKVGAKPISMDKNVCVYYIVIYCYGHPIETYMPIRRNNVYIYISIYNVCMTEYTAWATSDSSSAPAPFIL